MRLEYQIAAAFLLDLLIGDPRGLPHPVRLIGMTIEKMEKQTRQHFRSPGLAGTVTAITIIAATAMAALLLTALANSIHPFLGDIVSIFLLYTTFATRDLAGHSRGVYEALKASNLPVARQRVSQLVGRDTQNLTEEGVVRAAVESIAENSVDGVLAPLFYAVIGGPVLALGYKAASTLDSMLGYRNERYLHFGRTAAKIDDGANWLPARLSLPLIALAAMLAGLKPGAAWKIARRDGRRHLSPNSGISEAAFAGALGIGLGGPLERRGETVDLPKLGDAIFPLARKHIPEANRLMFATALFALITFLAARGAVVALLGFL